MADKRVPATVLFSMKALGCRILRWNTACRWSAMMDVLTSVASIAFSLYIILKISFHVVECCLLDTRIPIHIYVYI